VLRVEGLSAEAAEKPLTFDVAAGCCVGLLGRDLDALSRIARALSGLRQPSAGRVLIDTVDVHRDEQSRSLISVCLPRAAHHATTIGEHLSTIASARGHARLSVADAIARLGVDPRARLNSAAARSAAALLAALITETSVAVLHDPFAGLTDTVRRNAIEWIRSLSDSRTSFVMTGTEERDVRSVSRLVIEIGARR